MNPFEMVIAIVAIVMIARVIMHRQKTLSQQPLPPVDSADTIRLRDEVKQLKERVQVLERVITDNRSSMDLDQEIERLRDR